MNRHPCDLSSNFTMNQCRGNNIKSPEPTRNTSRRRRKHSAKPRAPARTYSKQALTTDQVLDRLKSKGLELEDEYAATLKLKSIGYYRLLIYMRHFQIQSDSNKRFKDGTRFQDLISLYDFDRKIRLLTLDAIEHLEVALRASLSNALTPKTPNAHWHLDPENYQDGKYDEIRQTIEKSVGRPLDGKGKDKQGIALQHYHNTYKDPDLPPIWLTCEKLSFGALSRFFASLSTHNRKHVARYLWESVPEGPQYPESLLRSWFQSLTDLRNVCAHQNRVWNTSFTTSPPETHKGFHEEFEQPASFYCRAAVIQLLLRPLGRHEFWKDGLQNLLKNYPHVCPRAHLGFPDKWSERPLWVGKAVLDSETDYK